MAEIKKQSGFVTIGSLFALIVGVIGGLLAKKTDLVFIENITPFFEAFAHLWVTFLLILILPIAGSYIVYVFISISNTKEIGKIGGISLAIHSGNLLMGVVIGLGLGYFLIQLFSKQIPVFSNTDYATEMLEKLQNSNNLMIGKFVSILKKLQVNLGKIVLYFIVISIISALILARFKSKLKTTIYKSSKTLSERSFKILQNYLYTLPLAVFSLLFIFFRKEGLTAAGVAGFWIIFLSALTLLLFFIQYVLVAFYGSISLKQFIKYLKM